jgi:putative ABC transport system permease protein
MLTLLREISLRHLRFSPLRTALVVLGIALGVCMLCAVLATNNSLVAAFEDMVDRVAGKADLTVAGSDSGIPSSLTGEIAEVEGVEHAAAMLEVTTRSADGTGGALLVLGVDFLGDTFFLPFAEEGKKGVVDDPLAFANDPTAILISKKLAKERNLALGGTLPLVTTSGVTNFRVKGLLDDKGPAASFGGQVVVMFIDAAQVSFSRGYAVDRIDVALSEDADKKEVKARIQKVVEGKAGVEEPQGRTRRLVGALWAFRNGLNMSGGIALGVGMFLIYNAVSISVAQRRREVGTLRALGVTRSKMVWLFCLEALVMAVWGTALGILMASSLAQLVLDSVHGTVDRFLVPIHAKSPDMTLPVLVAGIAAGLITTLLASYFPARAASRIDPAEALRASRSSALSGNLPTKKLALIGLALTSLAIIPATLGGEINGYIAGTILMWSSPLFVPLIVKALRRLLLVPTERLSGIPGRLALDNAERALGRSAMTVVALMFAVALSVSVGTYANSFELSMMDWVDNAIASDASITAGSPLLDRHHMPFPPSALEKLEGTPGLLSTNAIRSIFIDYKGRRMVLQAGDTETTFREGERRGKRRTVIDGPKLTDDCLSEAPRVLISENLAQNDGLHPGDSVTLNTSTGPRPFTIYAVVVDYSSDQGWFLMDRKWFREYWQDELIDSIDLFFAPGADRANVVNVVRGRLGATHDLFVSPQDKLREELRSAALSVFAYAKAPEIISLIVAIMGVIGTMLAAVLDRIREIGMLRAIGATRSQVTMSLMWEAGFLGLSAAFAGILCGIPLGYVLIKVVGIATSGWSLPYYFPVLTALRTTGLVVGAAILAGFFPGRRAAQLDVKEALSFE